MQLAQRRDLPPSRPREGRRCRTAPGRPGLRAARCRERPVGSSNRHAGAAAEVGDLEIRSPAARQGRRLEEVPGTIPSVARHRRRRLLRQRWEHVNPCGTGLSVERTVRFVAIMCARRSAFDNASRSPGWVSTRLSRPGVTVAAWSARSPSGVSAAELRRGGPSAQVRACRAGECLHHLVGVHAPRGTRRWRRVL